MPSKAFKIRRADHSSSHLDLTVRVHILNLCRILYDEKTSYIVTFKIPKKRKRFVCHSLGKVCNLTTVSHRKGKIIMRWEYPGEAPPTWNEPTSAPVGAVMGPPPLKLKLKLKGV